MGKDFVCRWDQFDHHLVASLSGFYEQKKFSDVTIACDGQLFKAHRIVLAACSPYFEMLFSEHPSENQIIHMHNVSAEQMEFLMDFIYKGFIRVHVSKIKPILELGLILQIKELSDYAMSVKDVPADRYVEQLLQQNGVGLNTGTVAPPVAQHVTPPEIPPVAPSIAVSPPPTMLPASSVIDTLSPVASGPVKISKPISKIGKRRNAIDCVEAIWGMDPNSSSADGYPSDCAAPFNSSRPHNGAKPIKRTRSTLNKTPNSEIIKQDSDVDFDAGSPTMLAGFSGYDRPTGNYEIGESSRLYEQSPTMQQTSPDDLRVTTDAQKMGPGHMDIPAIAPGEKWFQGRLQFMLSQRGKPLLVHDGHSFGIQYIRKDKKYWQCNLSRKYNCKARVTTTNTGDIIVTNNEHCHTEIRQHLRKDYKTMKLAASLAASRASFAVSLALPTQLNPAIDCNSSTSAINSTFTMNDSYPSTPIASGLPDTEQDIRSMNLTRIEQVQR